MEKRDGASLMGGGEADIDIFGSGISNTWLAPLPLPANPRFCSGTYEGRDWFGGGDLDAPGVMLIPSNASEILRPPDLVMGGGPWSNDADGGTIYG